MRTLKLAAPFVCLFCLLSLLLPAAAQDSAYDQVDCPLIFPVGNEVECGYITVPEEYANPSGATIRVFVAVFKSLNDQPFPDPVIMLTGGPGQNAVDQMQDGLNSLLAQPLRERDVIILDQRGMGYSLPSLACPEVDEVKLRTHFDAGSTTDPLEIEAARQCYERLISEGINISAFNTVESAGDVSAVVRALGYTDYNIWAGSYGSTLALTVMRNFPRHVRSVMLTSVSPPQVDLMAGLGVNYQAELNVLEAMCRANTACVEAFPSLKGMLSSTIEHLNQEPAVLTFDSPLTGEEISFQFNGDDLSAAVLFMMYNPAAVEQLPEMIGELSAGHYEVLIPIIQMNMASLRTNTDGAFYAMRCMDDVLTTTPDAWLASIETLDPMLQGYWRQSVRWWTEMCGLGWGAKQLDPIENTPVMSDIPTLLVSGEFDPVTPPAWGRLAAETLSNSYVYDVPDSAHGAQPSPCTVQIYLDFLDDPTQPPDVGCIANMPSITFNIP